MRPARGRIHGPAVGGHGVDVVEQQRIGRDVVHVVAQIRQHRDGAQGTEDAARPQRVAHALLHAVFLRDIDVHFIGV